MSNFRRTTGIWLASMVAVQTFVGGCAGMSDGTKQVLGTVLGAGAGALAGREVAGKRNEKAGMLIGGVVGGVAGYLLSTEFGTKATPEQQARPEYKEAQTSFDAGVQAQKKGDNQAALTNYQSAITKAPEQPEPYVNAGYVYLDENDEVNAEASFRKALTLDPNNTQAKAGLERMGITT